MRRCFGGLSFLLWRSCQRAAAKKPMRVSKRGSFWKERPFPKGAFLEPPIRFCVPQAENTLVMEKELGLSKRDRRGKGGRQTLCQGGGAKMFFLVLIHYSSLKKNEKPFFKKIFIKIRDFLGSYWANYTTANWFFFSFFYLKRNPCSGKTGRGFFPPIFHQKEDASFFWQQNKIPVDVI